jgi:hypothetical protein
VNLPLASASIGKRLWREKWRSHQKQALAGMELRTGDASRRDRTNRISQAMKCSRVLRSRTRGIQGESTQKGTGLPERITLDTKKRQAAAGSRMALPARSRKSLPGRQRNRLPRVDSGGESAAPKALPRTCQRPMESLETGDQFICQLCDLGISALEAVRAP